MKLLLLLCVLGVPCVSAATHSLKYFYTASSQVPNFPEFVIVGLLDEVQMFHYDSNTQRAEIKQEWMKRVTEEDPEYLEGQTQRAMGDQQNFKANIEIAKQRFNQTGGAHIAQRMYGCEWDDETGHVDGFDQHGYDGEDFISLDLKNLRYIAPNQQAVITKHKWDNNRGYLEQQKNYYTKECPEWGKKYLAYGQRVLMRTELPTVSLLQKTPSSPITCHATGFYPDRADLIWKKGDEELHEGVAKGQVLPNHDGTFQMSVDLDLSGVADEGWSKYSCVFQLDGVKDDHSTVLDKNAIRTNRDKGSIKINDDKSGNGGPIAGIVVPILLVAAAVIIGVCIWKRNNGGFQKTNTSETSSSSGEDSAVKKGTSEEEGMLKSRA